MSTDADGTIRCHYEVLGVERNAEAASIKKSYRKLALKYHPDKNVGNEQEAEVQFRMVQQAYECISDVMERKWYDDHREMILSGGTGEAGDEDYSSRFVFNVVPYQVAGCYNGYDDDDPTSFYKVYGEVFTSIFEGELTGWNEIYQHNDSHNQTMPLDHLPLDFGNGETEWSETSAFYAAWEGYSSSLNFAWVDEYDVREAPSRPVRRAMEEENKKKRKGAKRSRNDDVLNLVHFVKRRDPRIKALKEHQKQAKLEQEAARTAETLRKKAETQKARVAWRAQAQEEMAQQEDQDLHAGRFRLADDEDGDDELLYGKKKRGKKGRNKKGKQKSKWSSDEEDETNKEEENTSGGDEIESSELAQTQKEDDVQAETTTADTVELDKETELGDIDTGTSATEEMESDMQNNNTSNSSQEQETVENGDNDLDSEEEEASSEEEPVFYRCKCCRKAFQSDKQLENHLNSKKHKQAWKKYQKQLPQIQLLDDLALEP
eukprot:scaffold85724_cov50-Attheya_sp.AAC.2